MDNHLDLMMCDQLSICQLYYFRETSTKAYTGKSNINSAKNCSKWELNPRPFDDDSNTVLAKVCVGQEISEVTFVSCTTSHFGLRSFLELIKQTFIKVLKIQADSQMLT